METKHSSTPSARHLPSKVRFKFPFKHQNTFYEAEMLLGRLFQRDTDLDKASRLGPGSTSSPPLRTLSSCDQAQKTSINAVITQKCRMFFISQDWLQHYCPPGEETMHGSWWATHKQLQLFRAQNNGGGDVRVDFRTTWHQVETSSSAEAAVRRCCQCGNKDVGSSSLQPRCEHRRQPAVAQVSSCRFVRPSWTGITVRAGFFFSHPPKTLLERCND